MVGCKNSTDGVCLAGRLDQVPVAQACVAEALARAGVDKERICRAELIVEELFRNVVLHGYGGDSARPVWLRALDAGFVIEDEAPAFDPLSGEITPDLERVGGAGLPLIRHLGRAVAYARVDGRNQVTVHI